MVPESARIETFEDNIAGLLATARTNSMRPSTKGQAGGNKNDLAVWWFQHPLHAADLNAESSARSGLLRSCFPGTDNDFRGYER